MSYFPEDIPYMSKEGLEENGIRIPNDAINTNAGSDSEIPNSSDLISRQAAISHVGDVPYIKEHPNVGLLWKAWIESLPSAQPEPSEITDEQAILHLQSTGWMQNHDREMYESGLREQLADDSGGYDSLIPCEDTISRQAAIRWVKTECNPYGKPTLDFESGKRVMKHLEQMPPAQPEPLTDKEQRIFLAAMGREEKVCKQVDEECRDCREPYEDSLVRVCHEIERKVKGALWMI
jgi:hypothetical protein